MDQFIARLCDLNEHKHLELENPKHVNSIRGFFQKHEVEYHVGVIWVDDTPRYCITIHEDCDIMSHIEGLLDIILESDGWEW